jgi:hypothetical protein
LKNPAIKQTLEDVMGELPHSEAFIFDNEAGAFLHIPESIAKEELTLISFIKEHDIYRKLVESGGYLAYVSDPEIQRWFFFKRMAAELMLGISLSKDVARENLEKAEVFLKGIFKAPQF